VGLLVMLLRFYDIVDYLVFLLFVPV
jgi:hypothetical protein